MRNGASKPESSSCSRNKVGGGRAWPLLCGSPPSHPNLYDRTLFSPSVASYRSQTAHKLSSQQDQLRREALKSPLLALFQRTGCLKYILALSLLSGGQRQVCRCWELWQSDNQQMQKKSESHFYWLTRRLRRPKKKPPGPGTKKKTMKKKWQRDGDNF